MSTESFPILYFNLAGEMLYIIEQRLSAQGVEPLKAHKVLSEITLAVFTPKLICEVFKPHHTVTLAILRSIFEKLVHSSIMRLNDQSMNKLFDLMLMVVKYQIFSCAAPADLISISDNHLISILSLLQNIVVPQETIHGIETNVTELVASVRQQFLLHYHTTDLLALQLIRYSLLNFLKDIKTRVSIFLREGIQTPEGTFVIPVNQVMVECECQVPGVIRYFRGENNEVVKTEKFEISGEFLVNETRTPLGLNIYKKEKESNEDGHPEMTEEPESESLEPSSEESSSGHNANQEMDLLAKLICKPSEDSHQGPECDELRFDFLETISGQQEKPEEVETSTSVQVWTGVEPNQQLLDIINDLTHLDLDKTIVQDSVDKDYGDSEELDLLQLMDS